MKARPIVLLFLCSILVHVNSHSSEGNQVGELSSLCTAENGFCQQNEHLATDQLPPIIQQAKINKEKPKYGRTVKLYRTVRRPSKVMDRQVRKKSSHLHKSVRRSLSKADKRMRRGTLIAHQLFKQGVKKLAGSSKKEHNSSLRRTSNWLDHELVAKTRKTHNSLKHALISLDKGMAKRSFKAYRRMKKKITSIDKRLKNGAREYDERRLLNKMKESSSKGKKDRHAVALPTFGSAEHVEKKGVKSVKYEAEIPVESKEEIIRPPLVGVASMVRKLEDNKGVLTDQHKDERKEQEEKLEGKEEKENQTEVHERKEEEKVTKEREEEKIEIGTEKEKEGDQNEREVKKEVRESEDEKESAKEEDVERKEEKERKEAEEREEEEKEEEKEELEEEEGEGEEEEDYDFDDDDFYLDEYYEEEAEHDEEPTEESEDKKKEREKAKKELPEYKKEKPKVLNIDEHLHQRDVMPNDSNNHSEEVTTKRDHLELANFGGKMQNVQKNESKYYLAPRRSSFTSSGYFPPGPQHLFDKRSELQFLSPKSRANFLSPNEMIPNSIVKSSTTKNQLRRSVQEMNS